MRRILTQQVNNRAIVTDRRIGRDDRIKQDLESRQDFGLSMSCNRRCQMTASRKAHDSNTIWINIPFCSMFLDNSYCFVSVRLRNKIVIMRHPVFQNDGCHVLIQEEVGPLIAFMVHCQVRISPTRTNYNGTHWLCRLLLWKKYFYAWLKVLL